jgi:hypothetical protein
LRRGFAAAEQAQKSRGAPALQQKAIIFTESRRTHEYLFKFSKGQTLPSKPGVVMDGRKSFLLRIDAEVLDAVRRWADDELRSRNVQIEYLLRRALKDSGRLRFRRARVATGRGS